MGQVQSTNYLGITDNLIRGQYILEISRKVTKSFAFLRRNLSLIGLPSARVRRAYLASLSQNSDATGSEGAEQSCEVDLHAMEKYKKRW